MRYRPFLSLPSIPHTQKRVKTNCITPHKVQPLRGRLELEVNATPGPEAFGLVVGLELDDAGGDDVVRDFNLAGLGAEGHHVGLGVGTNAPAEAEEGCSGEGGLEWLQGMEGLGEDMATEQSRGEVHGCLDL